MSNIGKRPAVDEGRIIFQCLDKIGGNGVFQQHCHCAGAFEVTRIDRRFVAGVGHNHFAQTFCQVIQVGRQTENRHDFRGHNNIKPVLTRETVADPTQ